MNRRFVNLVTNKCLKCVYSLRRIDPYDNFFYGSAKAAIEAADEAAERKEPFPAMETLQLFSPRAGGGEGRMVYASPTGEDDLYDADENAHISLGRLDSPKGLRPMCLSIAHPGVDQDSMYILDRYPGEDARRCFEVLESMPKHTGLLAKFMPSRQQWRLLPPPPFVLQPGYKRSSVTSFTTMVDDNGCSAIYISCDHGIGTYSFKTAPPDSFRSEEWSHVGNWKLPFDGRAQYIPEFKLWFVFLPSSPSHLCAVDLSAMDHEGLPTERQVWQDLNPPEGEVWNPILDSVNSKLVHLGDGKFLIAKSFEAEETGEQFAVLTGIEMIPGVGDDHKLHMVKHKCARYLFRSDTIQWVF